jgi:hypothetical protein
MISEKDTRTSVGEGLATSISNDISEMVAIVTFALTLDRDPALQAELRRLSGANERTTLSLDVPDLSSAIQLLPHGGVSAQRAPGELSVDFESIVAAHDLIRGSISDGRAKAAESAANIVRPFFLLERLPNRAEFEELSRWAPLIERPAYRICARSINLVEKWRAAALGEPEARPASGSIVERYYGVLHAMTHLTLLASLPGAGRWLSHMANTFTWVNWTPSFPLVRERTVWLAAAAARSAAAFGNAVIAHYLRVLGEARHPMKAFDALFGLVAIACAEEDAFEPIVEGILRQQREMHELPMKGQEYTDLAYRTAAESLRVWARGLESPAHTLSRLNWRLDERGYCSLATREALTLDPTDLGTTGEMIGLAALPAIMRSPLSHHFPVSSAGTRSLLPRRPEMRLMLRRAWGPTTVFH